MTLVDKALWVIERNSGRDLTLPGIADACGVSRSHLASAFASVTGWPVVRYLRSRRLTQAAEALAAGSCDILGLALDAGYGSHEAFTRAFHDAFGSTPEQVREAGSTQGLPLVHPTGLSVRPDVAVGPPRVIEGGAIRAIGLAQRQSCEALIAIPRQWQQFMASLGVIPNTTDTIPIGIANPTDEDGAFEYVCAAEVTTIGRVPDGLRTVELPPRHYAVFTHDRHVSTLFDTYAAIWGRVLPALGWSPAEAPVIERHKDGFDPMTGEGGVAVWIPLA